MSRSVLQTAANDGRVSVVSALLSARAHLEPAAAALFPTLWGPNKADLCRAAYLFEHGGFYVDVGWGTYGFKAGPVAGEQTAEAVATGRIPELVAAFQLDRFEKGTLTGEKGAAAVGH